MPNYHSEDSREFYWLLNQTVEDACYHIGLFRTEHDAKDAVKDDISDSGWMSHEGGWFEAIDKRNITTSYHVLRMPLLTPEPESAGHAAEGEAGANNRPAPGSTVTPRARRPRPIRGARCDSFPHLGPYTRFDAAEIISDNRILGIIAEPERRRSEGGVQAPDWHEDDFRRLVLGFAESNYTNSDDPEGEPVYVQFDPGRDHAESIRLDGTRK